MCLGLLFLRGLRSAARQPEWDGNDNLTSAEAGQRVHAVGDVFRMTLTNGKTRENHIVEFEEGMLIAWRLPSSAHWPKVSGSTGRSRRGRFLSTTSR